MITFTEGVDNILVNGDCLEVMKEIENKSVDLILCDLPYGTTQNKWDSIINLKLLWKQYERIIKDNGIITLTAQTPFDKVLGASNINLLKYEWIWEKSKATGYLNSKKMPLKSHENILVFYNKPPIYNPQMTKGKPYNKGKAHRPTDNYGKQKSILVKNDSGLRYPRTNIYFKTAESEGKSLHPTQKPIALMEYLIKTYTNKEMVVLDNCMGSGTTGVACLNTERKFIGIELNREYFEIATKRINNTREGDKR